jgi:hypothetical protein
MSDEGDISLLEKYHEQIKEVVTLSEFNMKEVQLNLPAHRHYWVGRLMFHKRELRKLQSIKTQARPKIAQKMIEDIPVGINQRTSDSVIGTHPIMIKIDEQIAEQELLIDYLTKIEANFRSMGFDIKNLTEIIKLETS